MTVRSTHCQCSPCIKKYGCPKYAKVVEMQRLTNRYVDGQDIIIRFQVEWCKDREVEKGTAA